VSKHTNQISPFLSQSKLPFLSLATLCFDTAEFYASVVESIMRGDNVGITARRSRSATAAASMSLQSPVSSCIAYFRSPRGARIHKKIISMRASVSRLCFCELRALPHFDFSLTQSDCAPCSCVFFYIHFSALGYDLGLRIATCCGCVMGSRNMLTNNISRVSGARKLNHNMSTRDAANFKYAEHLPLLRLFAFFSWSLEKQENHVI
jgi:hypothetical protein